MELYKEVEEKVGYYPDKFQFDGKIHRFGDKNVCWAIGYIFKSAKGSDRKLIICNNWSHGNDEPFKIYSDLELKADLAPGGNKKLQNIHKELMARIESEQFQFQKNQLSKQMMIFDQAETKGDTLYLNKKKIPLFSPAKISNGKLMIPLKNFKEEIVSFQFIDPKGEKRYMTGGKLRDSFAALNSRGESEYVFLCEGYATGSSIALAFTDSIVFCAFSAHRLKIVAEGISRNFPTKKIIICADLDKSGVGEKSAKAVCCLISNCIYTLPNFQNIPIESVTDFNDLHAFCGIDVLRSQLLKAIEHFHDSDFEFDLLSGFIIQKDNKIFKNYQRLAQYFNHQYHYVSNETGKTFIYEKTHYREITDHEIRAFAEKHFVTGELVCTKKDAEEFLGVIKRSKLSTTSFKNTLFDYKYINFLNGVYDIELNKLIPHSPSFFFTNVIPHKFDPSATCPTWDEFIEIFSLKRKELQDVLHEFIGFCISGFPYDLYSKALILFGEGSNGKSTIIRIIQFIVGGNNHSACEISNITTNRFMSAHLANSLVNISEEEPVNVFTDTGMFKKLTGGSSIFAEKKGKDGFSFINRSKLIITYNKMPLVGDNSLGFKRRLLIVPCDVNYVENPHLKISNVEEKIQQEISGVINKCLEGLIRILKNKSFTESDFTSNCLNELMEENNPFGSWWNQMIEITGDQNDRIPTHRLLDSYITYANPRNRPNTFQFGKTIGKKVKELQKNGSAITQGTVRIKEASVTVSCVSGVRFICL